jgi:hypothetical protein
MNSARIEALAAAILVAVAAGLLLMSMQFPTASRIFPIMVLVALLVAALMWLVRSLLAGKKGVNDEPGAPASNRRQLLGAAALTAAYGVGVSVSSFFIPTVIYIPAMAFVLGNRNLPVTIASGTGFAAIVYVVFVWLFERPIPLI